MRVWTIKSKKLFETLQKEKVIHCDPRKSLCITEGDFEFAYNWLSEQMIKRIGNPPEGVIYSIWAWHTFDTKHKKPDLRRSEFRYYKGIQTCIELEIPDDQVLLSDEEQWHIVLNNGYYGDAKSYESYDKEEEWFESLSPLEKEKVKRKSWEKIFNVFPPINTKWDRRGYWVQATFWELRLDQVVSVKYFRGRVK